MLASDLARKAPLVALLALACQGGSPSGTDAEATTVGPQGSSTQGSSTTGSEGSGEAGSVTAADDTDTGTSVSREICDRYLACIAAAIPAALPAAQMGFGENGTCWQGGEAEAQLCLDACQSGLEMYNEAYPEEPKCALCQEDAECDAAAGELCTLGRCVVTDCGDGVVDDEEVCDGQRGCDPDCLGPGECNPFSGHGCFPSEACVVETSPSDQLVRGRCFDKDTLVFSPVGSACGPDAETRCQVGLGCAQESLLAGCDAEGFDGCCTRLCDLGAASPCPGDDACVSYEHPIGHPLAPEFAYIGVCVDP